MKLRIRHGVVTVWITLSTVASRLGGARTAGMAGLLVLALATPLRGCAWIRLRHVRRTGEQVDPGRQRRRLRLGRHRRDGHLRVNDAHQAGFDSPW